MPDLSGFAELARKAKAPVQADTVDLKALAGFARNAKHHFGVALDLTIAARLAVHGIEYSGESDENYDPDVATGLRCLLNLIEEHVREAEKFLGAVSKFTKGAVNV